MPDETTDPTAIPPEPSGAVAPAPPVMITAPPVVKEPVIPVKGGTTKVTPPVAKAAAKKEEPKEETPLEHVQRIIREHDGQVSNIPVSHPTFWDAKNRL